MICYSCYEDKYSLGSCLLGLSVIVGGCLRLSSSESDYLGGLLEPPF